MVYYDILKDAISIAKQIDNAPLLKDLNDAQQQISELVQENTQLRARVRELEHIEDVSSKIERHEDAYLTLIDDPQKLIYCSCCWDTKKILVQGQKTSEGQYKCPACGTYGYYDKAKYDQIHREFMSHSGRKTISKGL